MNPNVFRARLVETMQHFHNITDGALTDQDCQMVFVEEMLELCGDLLGEIRDDRDAERLYEDIIHDEDEEFFEELDRLLGESDAEYQ